jgi:ornithine carbamoyltransferase
MNPRNLPHLVTAASISPSDREALIASARALQRAATDGAIPKLLDGKNIGLLCGSQDSEDAALFERAATELGARVGLISPDLSPTLSDENLRRTARTLGRLYDAIECQGLAGKLLQRIRAEAGVPVYDGIGCAHHPSAALTAELSDQSDQAGIADRRRHILQALLLSTLG